jgi:hypothetical protein
MFPKGLPGIESTGEFSGLDGLVDLLVADLVDEVLVSSTL